MSHRPNVQFLTPTCPIPVKPHFLHKEQAVVKNYSPRKSGGFVESSLLILCQSNLHIHNSRPLWKTPVEKPVKSVENCELSTGISAL